MPWKSSIVATLVFAENIFINSRDFFLCASTILSYHPQVISSCRNTMQFQVLLSAQEGRKLCAWNTQQPSKLQREWGGFVRHEIGRKNLLFIHTGASRKHTRKSRQKKASSSSFTLFFSLMQHNPPECRLPSTFHSCFSCVIPMEALFFSSSLWWVSGSSQDVPTHIRHTEKRKKMFWCEIWDSGEGNKRYNAQQANVRVKRMSRAIDEINSESLSTFYSSGFWFFNGETSGSPRWSSKDV